MTQAQPLDSKTTTPDATAKALHDVIARYQAAVRGGDIDGYTALFADDAIQMPAGAPDRFGPAAIHAGMKPALTQNKMDVTLVPHETLLLGHGHASVRVVITGTRTPRDGGAPAPIHFTCLFLLRESDRGKWKIQQQMWTVKS
jgi:uncharacterized protein (TIGR02246 family)